MYEACHCTDALCLPLAQPGAQAALDLLADLDGVLMHFARVVEESMTVRGMRRRSEVFSKLR
jgi:hypothetical protein